MTDIFERIDDLDLLPEPREPADGWKKGCVVADHKWALEIEEGIASLTCLDPHPESFAAEVDPQFGPPVCLDRYWEREDLFTSAGLIPVAVEHISDNTPSTPMGPAEYGYWIAVKPLPDGKDLTDGR